jgi:Protein tyrosine and serine/threonine kinase
MEKPRHCHPSLYDVMMSCWDSNPIDRPPFKELSNKLSHFMQLENSWDELFIDLQKLFDKCTSEM